MAVSEATRNDVPQLSVPSASTRVLVVEDDLVMQDMIGMVLQYGGHTVTCASNGMDALNQIAHDQPDMIFMDLMMPVLNGEATIAILKNDPFTSHIPIVAMSAGRQLRERAARSGADGVLAKPFDVDVLLAHVTSRAVPRFFSEN